MLQLYKLTFSFSFILFHAMPTFSSSYQNSSQLCHYHEKMALLHFKKGFTIDPYHSDFAGYPKTKSWHEKTDCCLWDGVTCSSISSHVIGLDLSSSQLVGFIHSNSTLFHLQYLQTLNLAFNNFYPSHISPNFGNFSSLKVLNLSCSYFSGDVPVELGHLSRLVSLDLSSDLNIYSMKMSHFDRIVRNLTSLENLHLSSLLINSSLPQTLANLSSLTSLDLSNCSLKGTFPTNIMKLPNLRYIQVYENPNLYVDPSQFNNLSSSLEVLDFGNTNMFRHRLPEYSFEGHPPRLRGIFLDGCNLYGPIPSWIWNTTEVIWLASNQFTGKLPLTLNKMVLSRLLSIHLSNNLLEGTIPFFFFTLPSINELDFRENHFSGTLYGAFSISNTSSSLKSLAIGGNNLSLELNTFSKMQNLFDLDLSNNVISLIEGVNHTYSWPNLSVLDMHACNLSEFPDFSNSKNLQNLDVSDNKIQGELPTWLYSVGRNSLLSLDISHNNLTGGLEFRSWRRLIYINVGSNSFNGFLPLPPPSTFAFSASNNQFRGEMSSSFCTLTNSLTLFDISKNQLSGELPSCLGKLSHKLKVLDLGSNLFHGIIAIRFKKKCSLNSIHLDNNRFEGKVPPSMIWCKSLQVLNLENNQFNGSFPSWLDTLPKLQVLILKSNNYQGSIKYHSKTKTHPFPKLQILNLSNNQFSGRLPTTYFENFKALMVNHGGETNKTLRYIEDFNGYYQDSILLTAKGTTLTYRIINILAAIDLSNNRFVGKIPGCIGQLTSLIFLNFSHNQFTSGIPESIANLNLLESLDLSHNNLEGNIPPQLVRLTFLELFNVSENQLGGLIPLGSQFSTFSSSSYVGNPGLCGDPLPKCAGNIHPPETPSCKFDFVDFVTSFNLWEIVFIGFGFGTLFGFIVGSYMLFTIRPLWFSRKVDKLEYKIVQSFKRR